ncbi:MAG: hypothetical protein IPK69_08660 [Phycisphaerales bacterium]|nr:MAG: hypothetical protein IPK69_08660 [Phycisphaerales bacterium]
MNRSVFGLFAVCGLAASAFAAAPETFGPFAAVISDGALNAATNSVVTGTSTGAYALGSVTVNGTLNSSGIGSWESESRIRVIPDALPLNAFTVQPFTTNAVFTSVTATGFVHTVAAPFDPVGGVTFRFFESFDDAGGADATWSTIDLTFDGSAAPTNPTGLGGNTGGFNDAATPLVVVVGVQPGANPVSSNVTVEVDLTSVGGSATQQLFDDGTNGDDVAGDLVFVYSTTVAGTVTPGDYAVLATINDAESRSAFATANLRIFAAPTALTTPTLCNVTTTSAHTFTSTGEVKWYTITLPEVSDALGTFFDIATDSSTNGTLDPDTEMALYGADGFGIGADDDSGPGFLSALTFGRILPNRPSLVAGGLLNDGFNGDLTPGTYYLAVSRYNTVFNVAGFFVTGGTDAFAETDTPDFNLVMQLGDACTIPPTGVGLATPDVLLDGATTLFTVEVTAGQNPVSTGLTVSADLSAIGGSATQAFVDDGTGGDVLGGDGIYSFTYTVPVSTAADIYALPFTVSDAESRTFTGDIALLVSNEPTATDLCRVFSPEFSGKLVNDATYNAGDVLWYKLQIPAAATDAGSTYLDITVFDSNIADNGFGVNDTEIGLYDSTGLAISIDDDGGPGFSSQLSFGDTVNTRPADLDGAIFDGIDGDLAAGTYYLAVSTYNAAFFVDSWAVITTGAVAGTIDVDVRTNIAGCVADVDDGTATGTPDGGVTIDDLLYYLAIFNSGNVCSDVDDGTATGARDGGVTIDDLLYYLARFNGGC